ncbi:acyl-CoA synthetase (AMP-forming)/AMP-acid ligase II [Thermus oshimai JL-2]|uniref:Acyl-CoA synthetase (AMP-forming)/AMP-acid ligase II n=1 Tax=Thermus oshimai JL-2 TaxID=751945 RepID=K7R6K6_THEOS|nr:long-chain fatty acid--CoA ligase [Thermus oshimai]AFV76564.1 acyl-CoA synthetase (AMP-forming)/AMP-acid ligase II [Thermus oshimai JL-2]
MISAKRPWLAHYDPGVPSEVDYPKAPLYALLQESARRFPEKVAVFFYGKELRYRELLDLSLRFARGLLERGLQKGDRVALMLPNTPQYVIAYFGTLLAGGVVVNLNPLYTSRELRLLLGDSGARFLVALDLLFPRFLEIEREVSVAKVLTTGIQDWLPPPLNLLYLERARREMGWQPLPEHPLREAFERLLESPPLEEPVPSLPSDVAVLQYTGGTTGTPKGAMLSHENLMANVHQVWAWMEAGRHRQDKLRLTEGEEVGLCAIPFFHVFGMTVGLNLGIKGGGKLILVPRPEPRELLDLIEDHKVTLFPGVPTLYVGLMQAPNFGHRDLTSLKFCISGAAPLPVEVARRFEAETGALLVEGYGLTEASPVVHSNPLFGQRKVGSVGLPLPGVEAKVVDERGQEVPVGEVGELIVRGPNVMKGYWNRPTETSEALKGGWLFTGDMARMDEEGYFYIVDRKKDLIIAGGYNIYPREVEEVLYAHPAVMEAAVVGVPDPYRGETVKAFVVLKPEYRGTVTERELEEHCRRNLAAYKVPRLWEFREELPKSLVGKVLRRVLREEGGGA